jgi:hypothetical protein
VRLFGSIAFTLTEALHVRGIDQVFGTQVQHSTRQGSERAVSDFVFLGQLAIVAPAVLVDGCEQRLDEIGAGRTRSHGSVGGQGICGFHYSALGIGGQFLQEVAQRWQILQIELTVKGIGALLEYDVKR